MDELERKLREFYESIEPDPEFIERLKALEHSPEAKQKPRRARRYLFPAAAAVMAAAALGTGWAYLRPSLPGSAPQPALAAYEAPAPDSADADYVNPPATEPIVPDSEPAPEPEPQSAEPAPEAPTSKEPVIAQAPQTAPEPQESPAAQSTPPEQESPPEPETEVKNDPPADDPDPPADDPQKKPEEPPDPPADEPQDDTGTVPIIVAQYQATGTQETLTLSNLTTFETAVIDVTGLLPPPKGSALAAQSSESEAEASGFSGAIYTGECTAFGWTIRYTLVQTAGGVNAVAEAVTQN